MSWSGLKKAINRAGTHVMMKTGQVESTVDLEYEFEERRYKMMEEKSNKLQKELKLYLTTLRQVTSSQQNVSESLSAYYGIKANRALSSLEKDEESEQHELHQESQAKEHNGITTASSEAKLAREVTAASSIAQEYFKVMKSLNNETIKDLEQPFFQTVINPIARFNSYYIEINEAIKKRSHKQLDYDALKNKVKRLVDNPPTATSETSTIRGNSKINEYEAKLADYEKQLKTAEEVYDTLNQKLKEELPKLINLRIPFLDPSFESFVKIQLIFFNENFQKLNDLQLKIDTRTRSDYIEGKLEHRIDDVLLKMRELNITGSI